MRNWIVFFILAAALLTLSACFTPETSVIDTGDKAADFTLGLVNGENITLSEVSKGKKAVLVFWTTWCLYCRTEVPHVERFYQTKQDKAAVVGINLQESKTKVEAFVKKMGITYPIALDTDGSVGQLYNVRGASTVVAIDKDGKIVYHGHSIKEMEERVDF